ALHPKAMIMELTLEQSGTLPPIAEHQPVEFAYSAASNARLALSVDGVLLDPFLRPGETTWRWSWNPGPAVGLHRLALTDAGPAAAGRSGARAIRSRASRRRTRSASGAADGRRPAAPRYRDRARPPDHRHLRAPAAQAPAGLATAPRALRGRPGRARCRPAG